MCELLTCPLKLRPPEDSVDAGEDLSVWNPVLPLYGEELPEEGCVEVGHLLSMALVHCPCFTCTEQGREYYFPVYFSFVCKLMPFLFQK